MSRSSSKSSRLRSRRPSKSSKASRSSKTSRSRSSSISSPISSTTSDSSSGNPVSTRSSSITTSPSEDSSLSHTKLCTSPTSGSEPRSGSHVSWKTADTKSRSCSSSLSTHTKLCGCDPSLKNEQFEEEVCCLHGKPCLEACCMDDDPATRSVNSSSKLYTSSTSESSHSEPDLFSHRRDSVIFIQKPLKKRSKNNRKSKSYSTTDDEMSSKGSRSMRKHDSNSSSNVQFLQYTKVDPTKTLKPQAYATSKKQQSDEEVIVKKTKDISVEIDDEEELNQQRMLNYVKTLNKENANGESKLRLYLGEMTSDSAERLCLQPVSFRLYHRVMDPIKCASLDDIPWTLPLYIVYCNAEREFFHYKVLKRKSKSGVTQYGIGLQDEPWFGSMQKMVNFYTVYAVFHHRGSSAECFPYWTPLDEEALRDDENYELTSPEKEENVDNNGFEKQI